MPSRERKEEMFAQLEMLFQEYSKAFIVNCDFVGSNQIQRIRIALRGQAVIMGGKNTLVRRCLRNMSESNPDVIPVIPLLKGNVAFVFSNNDLNDIRDVINEFRLPAAAKAGVLAPVSVSVPKGPTGMDPAQTTFFQTLNIATKINKGSIEIINDVEVVTAGEKVGSSQAVLLAKLGIKPFEYGLEIQHIYESGAVFDVGVLDIKDEDLMQSWAAGIGNFASFCLGLGYLTEASLPHVLVGGFRDLLAIAVEVDYDFPQADQTKAFLADPSAFMAAAAPAAAAGGAAAAPAAAAAAAAPEEEEEDEDEDMGFGLFD